MGIINREGALYFATGIDNTGLYSGKREALGILKAMAGEITSFDVFGGLGISAGIAFAQAAKESYNFEKRFQQSMYEVATLSSGVKENLTEYMNSVVDMTREIPVLADESAKALYQIVSAGYDGADGMKILEVSAKAAVGGVTETATAADAITTVLNAYKMEVSDAERVSDMLFTTAKLGKTTMGELGRSIAQVAPIAASYGIGIDQVLAAVASITKQGVPTAEAMTKIRAAIMGASNVLGDAAFQGRTFQGALQLIYDQADGSSSKLKELLGTDEALQAALIITGQNAKSAAADLSEMGNVAGASDEAFQQMRASAEYQTKLLVNNVFSYLRPLGEGLLNEIANASNSINESFENGTAQESLKAIGGLITTVTVALVGYKGSILAVSAAKQILSVIDGLILKQRAAEAIQLEVNGGLYFEEAASIAMNTSSRTMLIKAIKAQTIAQLKNAAAMLTNPYVLAAAAFAMLGYAIYKVATAETVAEIAMRKHNAAIEAQKKHFEDLKNRAESLVNIIRDETASQFDKLSAYEKLQSIMPNVLKNIDLEKLKTMELHDIIKLFNKDKNEQYVMGLKVRAVIKKEELDAATAEWQKAIDEVEKNRQKGIEDPGLSIRIGQLAKKKNEAAESARLAKEEVDKTKEIQRKAKEEQKKEEAKASIQNKAFWTKQKDDATKALDGISSAQKKLMDAGNFKGIDSKIVESYKKNSKLLKESEKELKVYDSSSKQESQADKLRENQEKNNEELLSLRQKNQQDEANLLKEGTEKKLALIKADYDAQKQAIEKQTKELAKLNKESSVKGLNTNGLTSDQQAEIDKANKLNKDSRTKQENEVYKSELQYMQDYLKEYGTFQQQKLAIAEEYNEKISKATNDWQKKSLEKEKNAAIQQVDINAIKQSIDWGSVFGEFGTMFKEQLQPTIDKLRAISTTDEFKSSSLQDQQILYDLINKLEQSNAVWNSDIFKRVSDDMEAYQSAMNGYIEAQNREKDAVNALASAKENLKRIENSGGDTSQAKLVVKQAEESLSEASTSVQNFGAKVNETTSELESSSAKAVNMFQSLESGLQGLTSGSLKGIGNGIMQLDKLFNGGALTKDAGNAIANGFQTLLGKDSKASKVLSEALGNSGMAGEIISAILGILDVIGEIGMSGIVTSLQDTIFNSVNKMLDDILSGDIIVKPFKNATSHIGKILDTITFGGFSSWTNNGNEKETADKISALTASNELLKTSIDELKDEIKGSNGAKSISAHNEARDAQKRYEENLRQVLDAQMGYHSSHHSNSYYWDLNDNSLNQVNKLLGTNLKNSWSDFSKLTADQMNEIRTHLYDVWSEMINQGKYGDRFKDDWNNYADQAGKAKELTDDLRENLAQISFDSLRDSFVDKLMDMRSDAASFADDFEEYMTRALLNFSIGDLLDDDLKEWYNSYTDTMNKQGGKLTDDQINFYRNWWEDMVNQGLAERDQVAKLTGYTGDSESSSQSSTSKGYQTMSQDKGDELNGRFTALQISVEHILAQNEQQTAAQLAIIEKLEFISKFSYEHQTEMSDMMLDILDMLGKIKKDTSNLYFIRESLEKIEDKIKNL